MTTLHHIDEERLAVALRATRPEKLDGLKAAVDAGNLDACQAVDALLSELQYVHAVLSGGTYYDYDAQRWVEGGAR